MSHSEKRNGGKILKSNTKKRKGIMYIVKGNLFFILRFCFTACNCNLTYTGIPYIVDVNCYSICNITNFTVITNYSLLINVLINSRERIKVIYKYVY